MPTGARSASFSNVRAKSFREITGRRPATASPADSTLIIIDAQNEYADGILKTADIAKTRVALASLVTTYRAAEQANPSTRSNIIHVVHSVPSGTPVFTPDTRLAAEFPEIIPLPGEHVIQKHFPGSFTGTDLNETLKLLVADGRGKKVVIAGYMAHVCVSMTARQASELGYEVLIVGDAVGDRDIPGAKGEEVTRMVLAELADAVGTVVQSADIKAEEV